MDRSVPGEPRDEALMVAHAAGDPLAFRALFDRYAGLLLGLMLRDRSREEARDLVQQTFLQLHRARADYDPRQPFKPWLYTIALNLKRESQRRQIRRAKVWADDAGAELDLAVADVVQPEQLQRARAVRAALATLPAHEGSVIELHWLDGLTFTEIAMCLGVTANAAKVRAHRGYQRLRVLLKDVGP